MQRQVWTRLLRLYTPITKSRNLFITPQIFPVFTSQRQIHRLSNQRNMSLPSTFDPQCSELTLDVTSCPRVFVIGDPHGCYDECVALIDKMGAKIGDDCVIFVGDLVAKGPKSMEVIEFVRNSPRVYSVRGNHDQHTIRHFVPSINTNQSLSADQSNNQSSQSTEPISYEKHPHRWLAAHLSTEQREWFNVLPLSIWIPSLNTRIVHAGLVPNKARVDQSQFDVQNMRNILPDHSATKSRAEGEPWITLWHGPEIVVFGHDAARGLQSHSKGLAFGLDTGCCYGGQLTAIEMRSKQIYQVDAARVYQQKDE